MDAYSLAEVGGLNPVAPGFFGPSGLDAGGRGADLGCLAPWTPSTFDTTGVGAVLPLL